MQVFVHGDSMKNHIVAIVYPDPEDVKKFCELHGIGEKGESHAEQVRHPEIYR